MILPFRLSITWQVRLLNGILSAVILVALVILAQLRIRAVLYGALDRTLREQAQDVARHPDGNRPRGEQLGPPPGDNGDFGGGPPPRGREGDDFQGRPRPNWADPGQTPNFPRPDRRGGRPPGTPPYLRYGTISLLPARRLPMDGQQGPDPWSDTGRVAAEQHHTDTRDTLNLEGAHIRVFSLLVQPRNGDADFIVQTAAVLEPTDATLQEIDSTLYVLLVPLALFAAVLGGFFTEMALAPVRRLAQAVGKIEPTNLSTRLPEPGGGDAFDSLAQLMNALLVRLESAFARQKRFTASASHELRTPLAVIKGATSLLLENPEALTPLQQRTLDRADQSVDRANRLISDLLTLTRTENGILPVRPKRIAIDIMVREVVAEVQAIPPTPNVTVVCRIPENLQFQTDADHLRRLLLNLLSNALRHTAQGEVVVSATTNRGVLELVVQDTGEGIPAEALPRLGEPFYRPDTARGRDSGGAGLGLSLCWGILVALGGRWNIESVVGLGTTVSVTIPAALPEPLR